MKAATVSGSSLRTSSSSSSASRRANSSSVSPAWAKRLTELAGQTLADYLLASRQAGYADDDHLYQLVARHPHLVTIPAEVRRRLGLRRGDRVAFVEENDRIVLRPVVNDVTAAFGLVRARRSVSLEKMDEAIRKRAGR